MSSGRIRLLLFPKIFRQFPNRRLVLNLLRILHIISFSIMVGGIFFHQDKVQIMPWFIGAVLSGFAMFAIDLYGSCIVLFEVRGLGILIKILLLLWMPFVGESIQIILLFIVIVVSSYVSHATKRIRHKSYMSKAFQTQYGAD